MTQRLAVTEGLALVFQGIERLKAEFPHRRFTIDGRLVGDIGEVLAALEYDVELDEVSRPAYDGATSDGRRVQVKATFKSSLTFSSTPDYYLGFQLFPDGTFDEVFNGPGQLIFDRYAHRSGIGLSLLSFPVADLRKLSKTVAPEDRIARRPPVSADLLSSQ